MNPNEQKTLSRGLRELAMQYPATPTNEMTVERVKVYVRQLSDLPLVAVMAALDRCGKTCDVMPSVAAIRKEVGNHATGPGETAESAWVIVRSEAKRVGYNRPPVFMDGAFLPRPVAKFPSELIKAAADSVGWERICNGKEDDARMEFIFAYRRLQESAVGSIQRGNFTPVETDSALDGGNVRALRNGDAA